MSSAKNGGWPELVKGVPKGLEHGLRNFWYPVVQSAEVPPDVPVPIKCLNEDLVVFRDAHGHAKVMVDRCPHRAVKLSAGRVLEGELQCAFHGLRFDGRGRCTLIPWEPADSKLLDQLSMRAYPTEELGGLVWAYLGDAEKFPPPPLRESVPEELTQPERFVHFLLPTDVWEANWLLVVDGSDGYHAVTLHATSQHHAAVREYVGTDVVARFDASERRSESVVPLADRRVKIVETDGHGLRAISVDREGQHLDHGHRLGRYHGERFNLPAVFSNVLQPVGNAKPYVSRLFKVPIDYNRTRLFRYAAWRAESDEERTRCRELFENIVRVRQLKTGAEDKAMAAAAGDLVASRANEFLLTPDRDVVRIRRRITDAFLAQQLEGKRVPDKEKTPSQTSLVFPI